MAYRLQALDVLPEIASLAKEVLNQEEMADVDIVARRLLGSRGEKKWAITKSVLEVGIYPSRPLMYWRVEMQSLPRNTRNCIRYLGDYMDLLVKELTFETLGKGRTSSMSFNAKFLLSCKDPDKVELARKLVKYCDYLYTPGKHDFQPLPSDRPHRFSAKEVVLTSYITARLARKVREISSAARLAVEKDNLYVIGDRRWGSANRVEYYGDPLERNE